MSTAWTPDPDEEETGDVIFTLARHTVKRPWTPTLRLDENIAEDERVECIAAYQAYMAMVAKAADDDDREQLRWLDRNEFKLGKRETMHMREAQLQDCGMIVPVWKQKDWHKRPIARRRSIRPRRPSAEATEQKRSAMARWAIEQQEQCRLWSAGRQLVQSVREKQKADLKAAQALLQLSRDNDYVAQLHAQAEPYKQWQSPPLPMLPPSSVGSSTVSELVEEDSDLDLFCYETQEDEKADKERCVQEQLKNLHHDDDDNVGEDTIVIADSPTDSDATMSNNDDDDDVWDKAWDDGIEWSDPDRIRMDLMEARQLLEDRKRQMQAAQDIVDILERKLDEAEERYDYDRLQEELAARETALVEATLDRNRRWMEENEDYSLQFN